MSNIFDLTDRIALITGAGGLLGPKHAEAIIEFGGKVIITDHHEDRAEKRAKELNEKYGEGSATWHYMDVTDKDSIGGVVSEYDRIDILINNAAKDPKVKKEAGLTPASRFESMTSDYWFEGINAALNGTFFCSQVVGNKMLEQGGGGVIYSAAKWAIIGMTKYLGVYFAKKNIRVNCLSPTGVFNDHPEDFVKKLSNIIPMGRMAHIDEYKGAIVFLCSDASSYMTGENMVIDGGKTVW